MVHAPSSYHIGRVHARCVVRSEKEMSEKKKKVNK